MKVISYSSGSKTSETNMWLLDGNRHICLTYEYSHGSGEIKYAATVFRPSDDMSEPTEQLYQDMEHTTQRRFDIRPVQTFFQSFLNYDEILSEIRHEMCHGQGCKGPRIGRNCDDDESVSSADSFLSLTPEEVEEQEQEPYQVEPRIFGYKTIHQNRYVYTDPTDGETREIFVCYKGSKSTGDLIYGASISHGPSDVYRKVTRQESLRHYETAMSRLTKCPVQMNIPRGFRHQLKRHADHREDVVTCIVDEIFDRKNGYLQIRGMRL